MNTNKSIARNAGLIYLIVVISGIFSLMYVPTQLIDFNNAAATYQNIQSHELLFRLGILGNVICYLAFMILPFALYKLLKNIHPNMAKGMVILVLIGIPVAFVNLQHKFAVLSMLNNEYLFADIPLNQLQQQLLISLQNFNNGINVLSVFWGLWLFPFGWLVFKSGFLPKLLGILLMLGCMSYLIDFSVWLLLPEYSSSGISTFVMLPASIGEIGICLWLLIVGVSKSKVTDQNA
jgi:hypothetical protein